MKSRQTRGNREERAIKSKSIVVLLLIAAGAAIYLYTHRRPPQGEAEVAYVLARTLNVVDTTAEIRLTVGTLKAGDRVQVLDHGPHWTQVRLSNGKTGWVENKDVLDAASYERGQRLLQELEKQTSQADGHVTEPVNLHLEPSREALLLAQLDANQKVEIFGRRLVERPAQADQPPAKTALRDAWYLVRADSRAGWVLGRLVILDAPPGIAPYAQGFNMVAWVVLNTVPDQGGAAPQYLVADRLGGQELDFNHIRVFTWWKKHHEYVTAYVEGDLDGYFPLRVTRADNVPYFRLRLIDETGAKIQKVYGMFDTIVRPIGMVSGWESDAMPVRPPSKASRARRARSRRRRSS